MSPACGERAALSQVSLTLMLFPMQHVGKDQKGEKQSPFRLISWPRCPTGITVCSAPFADRNCGGFQIWASFSASPPATQNSVGMLDKHPVIGK